MVKMNLNGRCCGPLGPMEREMRGDIALECRLQKDGIWTSWCPPRLHRDLVFVNVQHPFRLLASYLL